MFLSLKSLSFIYFQSVEKIKEKSLLEIDFDLSLQIYLVFFPSVFLCYSLFQILYFLILELSFLILSIGSYFSKKFFLWSIEITKCYLWSLDHQNCNLFFTLALCLSLLCWGDCVWERSSILIGSQKCIFIIIFTITFSYLFI